MNSLFQFNRKLHNNFVQRSWIDQILEKQKEREKEEREKAAEELERLRQIRVNNEHLLIQNYLFIKWIRVDPVLTS